MKIPFSESGITNLLNTSALGFVIFSKDLIVIYASENVEKITGYSPDDLLGTDFFDQLVQDKKYLKPAKVKTESSLVKSFNDLDLSIQKKTGEPQTIHIAGSSFKENNEEYIFLTIENVTSRKAFEMVMESSFDNFIKTTTDLDSALKKIKEQRQVLEEYQERIKKELLVANNVQKAIVPKTFPSADNVKIWAASFPSAELGGDYFDFSEIDDKLGIILADVSGHGVPAALITTMLKVHFTNISQTYLTPDKFLSQLNKNLSTILGETGFYLTALYCILDLQNMEFQLSCAAHEFALYYDPEKDEVLELGSNSRGTVIGSFADAEYQSEIIPLKKDARIIFFTDGITESRNNKGEFYGLQKLKDLVKEYKSLSSQDFVNKLLVDIDTFSESVKQSDDRTIVLIDILNIDKKDLSGKELKQKIDNAYNNGRLMIKKKDYKTAEKEFLSILESDDKAFGAYSYLGQIYCIMDNYKKAKTFLKKAVEINPEYYQGYYYLGISLYKLEEFREAKEYWVKLRSKVRDFKKVDKFIDDLTKKGI